jgi:FKBP-type peptidyl-prolyl cis-trans isomerase (trigger factor)
MQIELTNSAEEQMTLTVTAAWSEVAADYEDVLTGYSKFPVPGFRPGKAPPAAVEKHFRDAVRGDFVARCGRRLAQQALGERDIRAAGQMDLTESEFHPQQPFRFTGVFIAVPRLELPDYMAVPLATETDDARRDEISDWLLSHTPWNVPQALIRQECESSGLPDAQLGDAQWQMAEQRVKLTTILEQIGEAEGIEVDERDVDQRVERMASECGVKPQELRQRLARGGGLGRLRALLVAEQTLEYLLTNSTAQDTKILSSQGSLESTTR